MSERLRGNWATLLLPIAPDDAIEWAKLDEEIGLLCEARVDGIYSNGTAGEFHNQTDAEFRRIQERLAAVCRTSGVPYVIGACHCDPAVARERVAFAVSLQPAAIQVILPDWWPLTDAEAADFLAAMSDVADGCPLVLYNPPHAKRVLTPSELALVCRGTAVAAVKLADGDASWYAQARAHLAQLALFVPGHHLATATREGIAAGSFSNVACLSPHGSQAWTDRMRDDLDAALDVEARLNRFLDAHILPFRVRGFSNAALDKLLATIGAWGPVGPRLRRPYRWIDPAEADRLRPIARAMLPELFP